MELVDVGAQQLGVEQPGVVKGAALVVRRAFDQADETPVGVRAGDERIPRIAVRTDAPEGGEVSVELAARGDLPTQLVAPGRHRAVEVAGDPSLAQDSLDHVTAPYD